MFFQQWFALSRGAGSNPYRLYAASNAGSLLALLAYPVAIEPTLRLRAQSLLWAAGYAALAFIAVGCGLAAWNAQSADPRATGSSHGYGSARHTGGSGPVAIPSHPVRIPWSTRVRWLGFAFVPSSLMLSVTTFVSTDIAAIPLLWVVPLALYLVTLIFAFADRGAFQGTPSGPPMATRWLEAEWLFPAALIGIVGLIVADEVIPARVAIPAHMAVFVFAAWACHRRLAALGPDPTHLTRFYLWVAAGGALGGAFNTFVAPALFETPLEYPIVALLACLLFARKTAWPPVAVKRWRFVLTTIVITMAPALSILVLSPLIHRLGWSFLPDSTPTRSTIAAAPAFLLAISLRKRPVRLGAALALLMIAAAWVRIESRVTLHVERSFFGIHRVTDTGFTRVLLSGTTNHGAQAVNPALRCEPLSYYSRGGPVGQVFASLQARQPRLRSGVVGLGTASMAAYVRPGDQMTFFEINPAVERIARHPDYFTYLRDCAPAALVVLGDARLSLERVPDHAYDVLVLDAFSSDAIPVHLMTTEAVALYFRKLATNGLLALHISNRYLDLAPVIAAVVQSRGLVGATEHHKPDPGAYAWQSSESTWVVVARERADLLPLLRSGLWQEPVAVPGPLWTDDYSNVVRIIKR